MLTYRNTAGEYKLYSSLANREGSVRLTSNRRLDVSVKVGGPALYVDTESLGTASDAGEVLIHAWTQGEHAPTVKR